MCLPKLLTTFYILQIQNASVRFTFILTVFSKKYCIIIFLMSQPLRIQLLTIRIDLIKIAELSKKNLKKDPFLINSLILDIESYLNNFSDQKVSRSLRLCLNKFARDFWLIKVALVRRESGWVIKKALTWANILQHRAKLA